MGIYEPIISKMSRIRHPEAFFIGKGSILDDFCYISVKTKIGQFSHIASGCSLAGGEKWQFELGDFSSLSSGVKVWCSSSDYVNDAICSPMIIDQMKDADGGNVIFSAMTGVGANSVIMYDNFIPEGVAIGALSYVPPKFTFEPWMVYAGAPIKPIKKRNKKNVMSQIEGFLKLG